MYELGGNRPTHLGNEDGGVSAIGAGAAVELPARATHRQTPPGHGADQLIVPFLLIRAATLAIANQVLQWLYCSLLLSMCF